MPNIKSAKKRMELSRVARTANRSNRARIRTAIKRVRTAANADEGVARLQEAVALLDRAATRRLYHPNAVARVKSSLQRHVNGLSA
ncbi:MAG: 30S ribosomal protein S20 [Gemmatimonadota bacterium]|nr:30S ribosomal protein S20 [Gemmatimonadota bacterium]MDH5758765.1 30S ribosomal protein S20 [Gemmatimonadota bacterium]